MEYEETKTEAIDYVTMRCPNCRGRTQLYNFENHGPSDWNLEIKEEKTVIFTSIETERYLIWSCCSCSRNWKTPLTVTKS